MFEGTRKTMWTHTIDGLDSRCLCRKQLHTSLVLRT